MLTNSRDGDPGSQKRELFYKYVAVHNVLRHNDSCLLHLLQEMDLARLERAFFLTAVMLKTRNQYWPRNRVTSALVR